ncbi:bifunctional precorrin-2 dehydrogenase/sirohydrochlorin ferrochelatase [Shewanella avicenniae]|uniref:precorrin-2 dehydrogenase n=1 Tax=Shewanella avicenniae TaxID=2814294 RepID=A0ABX7QLV2_9GAMM|nr:bifunctional precorrin-2 dehydrogenase/sirohydrochlorin ferrochelatase [Shewanella avicenniae]QSX32432.1 bifunctional precorrin-2 dehydrogenase/sirohydrochlorin ferrochelatase [Shewanella avicenniae]
MQYFPLFLNTQQLRVLVIGAGDVACRKLDLLCRTDAIIEVIAPEVSAGVLAYAQAGRIALAQRRVTETDLHQRELVYIATADQTLNLELARLAKALGALVNVVDTPSACDFITPSIVDRGRLVVAISTAGAAPVFARDIRAKLEAMLPVSLAPLFDFIAEKRTEVQQRISSGAERRRFWERFFAANGEHFDGHTLQKYQQSFAADISHGELLLVCEDCPAELLPLAALPLMQRIDAVVSLAPIPDPIAELMRRDAERLPMLTNSELLQAREHGKKLLLVLPAADVDRLKIAFPFAKHLRPGAI